MQIRAIGCIERTEDGSIIDPTTGYIYDPLTGLPIDLGTVGGGEGGGNQLELDCFNKFLNFIEYYKDKENKPAEYFVLIQYLVCLMDNCNSCLNLPFTKLEDNKKCSVTFCNLDIPDVIEEEEEEEELPEFPDIDLGIGVDDTWINVEPIHTDMEDTTIVEQSPVWWYHSDHLGSSSYITDILGKPVQYYEYLPFGEIMVQQSTNNIFENVYKFNGKELDEQTGYYYYGARYYDPGTSIFLSVDPLAEDFANFNPYTYTFNNPIMFTDPTGMAGESIVPKTFMYNTLSRGYDVINNRFTKNFAQAARDFNSSKSGGAYVSQFMKKGESFAGITATESGKFSKYDLRINDISISDGNERGTYWGTTEAVFRARVDDNSGKLYFEANFDTGYDSGTLLENLGHELLIHGNVVEEIIDFYEKNGSEATQGAIRNGDFSFGDSDHKSLRDKDSNHKGYRGYESLRNEMSKGNSKNEKAFNNAEKKYDQNYKSL